jgi:hypothetical protein
MKTPLSLEILERHRRTERDPSVLRLYERSR